MVQAFLNAPSSALYTCTIVKRHRLMMYLLQSTDISITYAYCFTPKQNQHNSLARSFPDDDLRRYFADDLQNEGHFRQHLDKILIPRVPGTVGSNKVRQVRDKGPFALGIKTNTVLIGRNFT